jgi:hypothetical protein
MQAPVLDPHIRAVLVAKLRADDPSAVIFQEQPLSRSERRADVVAVNGSICGYEIKSERDSLARLAGQADHYAGVCEYMTVVLARRHLRRARCTVPAQWGIMVAEPAPEGLTLRSVRRARRNRRLDTEALIRLLWRDECVRVLRNNGVRVKRNALVIDLWASMALLPPRTLLREVRDALKARGGTGSDSTSALGDG